MSANVGVVRVELVGSIRPSMRLPIVLKRCEDDPGKISILNKGFGFQSQTGLLMSAHLISAWQTSTCRFDGSSEGSCSNDWKLDMNSGWTLMSVASRVL